MKDEKKADAPITRTWLALIALFFLAPAIHWLALGPQIPEGTFFLISQLLDVAPRDDPSNVVYSFARPPIYALLGWVHAYPLAYLLVGIIAHAAVNACVFVLAYVACKEVPSKAVPKWLVAAVVTFLVFPVGWWAQLTGHGTTLVPHDAYYTFSFRTFACALLAIGYIGLVTGRLRLALWIVAASSLTHPTAGLLAFGLFSVAVIVPAWKNRDLRLARHWLAAAAMALAPVLWKLLFVELPPELQVSMTYESWYSQMIKDEADDFSVLYQFLVLPKTIFYFLALIGAVLFVYARVFTQYRRDISFWFAAAIPTLFVISGFMEYLFGVLSPGPLLHPLISLTVGYRLLSFVFFPMIVLCSRLAMVAADRGWSALRKRYRFSLTRHRLIPVAVGAASVAMVWSYQLARGIRDGNTHASLAYGAWAVSSRRVPGIDHYLSALAAAGADQLNAPRLFELSVPVKLYPNERNIFRIRAIDKSQPQGKRDRASLKFFTTVNFADFTAAVRARIPAGEGLIIPPYFEFFRDALPTHRIFFQEHHDGNLMLGSPRFTEFWRRRMDDLLGFSYEGMPSKYSGLSFTHMRAAYLAIDGQRARSLKARYPSFRYFVTEAAHALPYEVAFTAGGFVVFNLDRPTSPSTRFGTAVILRDPLL